MGEVVNLDGSLSVEEMLEEAKEMNFADIIILGVSEDDRLYLLSSMADKPEINFFLDHAKAGNLHG